MQWGEQAARSASKGLVELHKWLDSIGIKKDAINCVFTEASCYYNEILNNGEPCLGRTTWLDVSAGSPFPNLDLNSGSTNHYRNKIFTLV